MSLAVGQRIGAFEITGSLGAGGMGEVYRATDTKLKRHVAIKILPEAVASHGDHTRVTGFMPYDVAPDGRFLINTMPADATSRSSITVVVNWFASLEK